MLSDLALLYGRRNAPDRPARVDELHSPTGSPTVVSAQSSGQLVYPITGIGLIRADGGSWVVLPGHAAWLSPFVGHELRLFKGAALQAIVEPSASTNLPKDTGIIATSPLLREAIDAASRLPRSRGPLSLEQDRLLRLFVDELVSAPIVPRLALPMPRDERLRTVCTALLRNPACAATAPTWAKSIGMTAKTLHLIFRKQATLSFVQWRQRARLFHAVELLAAGTNIETAALACGYGSGSALTAVFRRHFGLLPSRLLSRACCARTRPSRRRCQAE